MRDCIGEESYIFLQQLSQKAEALYKLRWRSYGCYEAYCYREEAHEVPEPFLSVVWYIKNSITQL